MAPVDRKPGSSVRRTRVPRMLPLMLTPCSLLLQASRPGYGDRQQRSNPPPVPPVKPEGQLQVIPNGGMLRFCDPAIKAVVTMRLPAALAFEGPAGLHAARPPVRPPPALSGLRDGGAKDSGYFCTPGCTEISTIFAGTGRRSLTRH